MGNQEVREPSVAVQAGSVVAAVIAEAIEKETTFSPPWEVVLAESLVGIMCNCVCGWLCMWSEVLRWIMMSSGLFGEVVGLVGFIYAVKAKATKLKEHHRISHYMGIASIAWIALDCIVLTILSIIALIWYIGGANLKCIF